MTQQYTVVRGDSLSAIAARFGLSSYRDIYDHPANAAFRAKRPNPNLIYAGDVLFIPDPKGGGSSATKAPLAVHARPMVPKTVPGVPTGDATPYVVQKHANEPTRESWNKFRESTRKHMAGNPNAARVEAFLNKIEADATELGQVPVLNRTVLFGKADASKGPLIHDDRDHNATSLEVGNRVSTTENTQAVILFGNNGGSVVLGANTLLIVLPDSSKPERHGPGESTLVYGQLRERLGELAGKKPATK